MIHLALMFAAFPDSITQLTLCKDQVLNKTTEHKETFTPNATMKTF